MGLMRLLLLGGVQGHEVRQGRMHGSVLLCSPLPLKLALPVSFPLVITTQTLICACVLRRFDGVTSMMYHHHGLSYAFTGNYDE